MMGPVTEVKHGFMGLSWPMIFALVAFLQAGTAIALEAFVFAQWQLWVTPVIREVPTGFTVPTYLAIVLFGFIYEIFLILDAMRLRNNIQIVAACLHNICMAIYLAIQRGQMLAIINTHPLGRNAEGKSLVDLNVDEKAIVRPSLLALPIVVGVGSVALCALANKVTKVYSWTTWKRLHGDLMMKRRLLAYQIYVVLLKYDFFVITAFLVVYTVTVLGPMLATPEGVEGIVNSVMIFVVLVTLVFAAFWTKREVMLGMIATIFLFFVAIAYLIYKLIVMHKDGKDAYKYEPSLSQMTMYASLSIIFLSASICNGIVCALNAGKGLKDYFVAPKASKIDVSYAQHDQSFDVSSQNLLRYHPTPQRLSLD